MMPSVDATLAVYNLQCVCCGAQATHEPWGQKTPAGQPISNGCLKCMETACIRWPTRRWDGDVAEDPTCLAMIPTITSLRIGEKQPDFLPKSVDMTQRTR